MDKDLEVIRKIREKEDQENKITEDLKKQLKKELDQLQAESELKIKETAKGLDSDYQKKMESLQKKTSMEREDALNNARAKANALKLRMSDAELKELVNEILTKYLEE